MDSFSSCPCSARFIQTIADGYIKGEPSVEKAHLQAIAQQQIEEKQRLEASDRQRVFAKSCLRGEGCNDAGEQQEPHTHFAAMAFYQAIPPAVPTSDSDVPQYGQSTKKKNPVDAIPKPKKRSALYKWLNGDHEEFDDQQALAVATSEANADKAVEGASVFGLIGGHAITSEAWAVKLGELVSGAGRIAASGPGAPIVAIVMGMMPGKLNEGEQDYLDRLRLEQMHEAPRGCVIPGRRMRKVTQFLMAGIRPPVKTGCVCVKWSGTVTDKPIRSPQRTIHVSPLSGHQTVQVSMFLQLQATSTR